MFTNSFLLLLVRHLLLLAMHLLLLALESLRDLFETLAVWQLLDYQCNLCSCANHTVN